MSSSSSLYKLLGLGAGSPVSASHLLLLVLGAGFLALTVFVVHPNGFRIQSFFSGGCRRPATDAASAADAALLAKNVSGGNDAAASTAARAPDDVRVLIGIQTLPSKYEQRNLLRTIYSLQAREQPSLARSVYVRFVFCNVTSPVDAVLVALEVIRHGDIIVLDCAENMDNGKTHTFFSTVARAFNGNDGARYDYVGPEDMWTGRWLNLAGKAKNRYDMAPRMYNYRGDSPPSCFRHDFVPDTIAVHMLKDAARWAETLRYFNVTAALPPSHL